MDTMKIAVVGSGVSGLSAAWLLSKRHHVTLYEVETRLGGHANTVDVTAADGPQSIDTGFIVYNERNYPNLTALFDHLGVRTEPTEMSFALSLNSGAYEYSGSGFNGFFGQPRNLIKASHWRLLGDISRFFRSAQARLAKYPAHIGLGPFLTREGYSETFIRDHIVPMGAAVWSTPMACMLGFPARSFIDFYANHGMLQFTERTLWRTVTDGSRRYVDRLVSDGGFEVQAGNAVKRVARHADYVHIVDERGVVRPFDQLVIATHADQALALLEKPSVSELDHLGKFSYSKNHAVLHRDARWMPKRRRLWSSWNYIKNASGFEDSLCLTYWMNRLQNLKSATDFFVTLNPPGEIHPKAIEGAYSYSHPVFSAAAMEAQKSLWVIQGVRRTWFCGSYFGYGFHEDGVQSGLAVAEQLGALRRPWQVEDESGRIAAPGVSPLTDAAE